MSSKKNTTRAALAALVAAATLVSPFSAYAGEGGGGSGSGTGSGDGTAGGVGKVSWVYKDNYGTPTRDNAIAAMQSAGVKNLGGAESNKAIDDAVNNANAECVARSQAAGQSDPQCRLVSVGFVHTPGSSGDWYTGANGSLTAKQWQDAWVSSGIPNNTYNYNGTDYKTSSPFNDGSTTINSLVKRETDKAPRAFIAIALSQYEPAPANYDLTVTTNHRQGADLKVGSTTPIGNTLHASNNASGIKENLNGTAVIHYEGQKDGYVAAKTVSKPIAYAKLVDTGIPATGQTVRGDPQPADLKAYGESDGHDPLSQPAIDQNLLGHTYTVTMPMTVIKVTDGHVVRNKATQVFDRIRKDTNEVTNPLKPINPAKDVTVKVGGASANGRSIYKDSTFLYQLDSSILPTDRAYPQVDQWDITDALDPAFDEYTGQWAVYATRDLLSGGEVVASKGERIAGSDFDSSKLGGDLFTLSTAVVDGRNVVTIEATGRYRALVSDDSHEAGWRAYIQCKRLAVTDRHENRSTEHYNDKEFQSNIVWTRTPDMTPSIDVQKWDRKSGWPNGDRDNSKDALTVSGDTEIVFTITNTSKTDPDTQQGAVYRAKDLKLEDSTIAGDGEVVDLKYPDDWDTRVLKPGESVEVTGTLKGVTKTHTDRAKVTGTPLVECPVTDTDPFGGKNDETRPSNAVDAKDGDKTVTLCSDTKAESNTDDWNGYRPSLARTGAAIGGMLLAVIAVGALGTGLLLARRKASGTGTHGAHSGR